jgi:hypothetical protein
MSNVNAQMGRMNQQLRQRVAYYGAVNSAHNEKGRQMPAKKAQPAETKETMELKLMLQAAKIFRAKYPDLQRACSSYRDARRAKPARPVSQKITMQARKKFGAILDDLRRRAKLDNT